MMTDPISDMLTRIRNGLHAEKVSVRVPASKLKRAIAQVLKDEGYIENVAEAASGNHAWLEIQLKYHDGRPVIERLNRVSKPGLRVYLGAEKLPRVEGGFGVAIVSTSKGIMSDRAARKNRLGGEVLCIVS
jgi:small subunit ribosomal protein S8